MIHFLSKKLYSWKTGIETVPRVVMISGTGGKAFCAGGDIVDYYRLWKKGGEMAAIDRLCTDEYLSYYALATMDPIQIAIWNGIVMGGGIGISFNSPIRIATEKTVWAMPEAAIGYFCNTGGSYFLSRLGNNSNLGMYLGLTGTRLRADELVQWGAATHYVPTDKLDSMR